MGSGGGSTTSYPPPVDYSSAMITESENAKTVAMGQIMASQFAVQTASMDREMQISASLEQGLENLDTKLQIAKLNYLQGMQEEEDRHSEKMTEIGGTIDAARAGTDTQATSDFLSNNGGGYTPGGIFNNAVNGVNSSRVDFGSKWDTLLQNDKQQSANNTELGKKHEEERTQQLNDYNQSQDYQAYLRSGGYLTESEWKAQHA